MTNPTNLAELSAEKRQALFKRKCLPLDPLLPEQDVTRFFAQLRDADVAAGEKLGHLSIQASVTDRLNTHARELGWKEEANYTSLGAVQEHMDAVIDAARRKGQAAGEKRGRLLGAEELHWRVRDQMDATDSQHAWLTDRLAELRKQLEADDG